MKGIHLTTSKNLIIFKRAYSFQMVYIQNRKFLGIYASEVKKIGGIFISNEGSYKQIFIQLAKNI